MSELQHDEGFEETLTDDLDTPRGPYRVTSSEKRGDVIRLHVSFDWSAPISLTNQNQGRRPTAIADALGMKVSTARSITKRYDETGEVQRSVGCGGRPKLIGDNIAKFITDTVDEDCQLALSDIQRAVEQTFGLKVSAKTISRCLKDFHYTIKIVKIRSTRRDDEDVRSSQTR
jgi:transposase